MLKAQVCGTLSAIQGFKVLLSDAIKCDVSLQAHLRSGVCQGATGCRATSTAALEAVSGGGHASVAACVTSSAGATAAQGGQRVACRRAQRCQCDALQLWVLQGRIGVQSKGTL